MSGILDLFVPREKKFFELLNTQVDLLVDSVSLIQKKKDKTFKEVEINKLLEEIKNIETKSSALYLDILDSLHKTFVTPIDREEIKVLSKSIHKAIKSSKKISACIYFLNINTFDNYISKQLDILGEICKLLKTAFIKPLSAKENRKTLSDIRKLEDKADDLHDTAIYELFKKEKDAVKIIRQKELYEVLEKSIDKATSVADTLDTILVNNS